MEILAASREQIIELYNIDLAVFPPEWAVEPKFVYRIYTKNPNVFKALIHNGNVIGHYTLFPMSKESYFALLNGDIVENDIPDHIVNYKNAKEVYIYFATVAIHPDFQHLPGAATRLIKHIPYTFIELLNQGVSIKEVGCFGITEEGRRMATVLGMEFDETLSNPSNDAYVYRSPLDKMKFKALEKFLKGE